ncbi:uncharacterized protein LOC123305438 [Chrysoperla carnea]|uniref:uncharacterized protein LOC123305438 n=1 Tax=Chrysoperla carnea TaxID=189513 RepID=UPI001D094623|nr:uncharacterized protein LOC123305438 [Chrysoperla carnea]
MEVQDSVSITDDSKEGQPDIAEGKDVRNRDFVVEKIVEQNSSVHEDSFAEQNTTAKSDILKLEKSVQVTPMAIEKEVLLPIDLIIKSNEKKLNALTGIRSFKLLETIVLCVSKVLATQENYSKKCKLSVKNRVLLTFIMLKQKTTFEIVSSFFDITANTAKNCMKLTLKLLASALSVVVYWPSKEEILNNMPKCFSKFRSTRVVLDCTEVSTQSTECLTCRLATYSNYKGRHTVKYLVGVTPSGMISFISKGFGGRASDKQIVVRSKLLEKMNPNDAIMVDKGFLIANECAQYGVKLIRPPFFRKEKQQFSATETQNTALIAAARVHVERTIQRLKIFNILKGPIPRPLIPYMDCIMVVLSGIVNLSTPILGPDKF